MLQNVQAVEKKSATSVSEITQALPKGAVLAMDADT
jgi:hypothetical protein